MNDDMSVKMKWQQKGFTLLETTVAIFLFTFVIFGILMVLSQSLGLGRFSESRMIAVSEMRRLTEAMRKQVQVNTSGLSSITSSTTWATSSITNALKDEVPNVSFPQGTGQDPLPVQITLTWTEKGRSVSYTIDTLVTKR